VVIMRTPGQDRHLAAGFLLSEQIVRAPGDIAAMRYCTDTDSRDTVNVLNVWLAGDAAVRAQVALEGRRHVTANSACGVCGRRSIDDLLEGTHRVEAAMTVPSAVIARLPAALRAAQQTFEQTGGLHAAGLFSGDGVLVRAAEDVGRHNAVDKLMGLALQRGIATTDRILLSTGRVSSEMLLKAARMSVPIVASRTSPTEMAVALAEQLGVTVVGYLRGDSLNLYAGQALDLPDAP
jgi:FdhD protein